jgi:hypothetical protein
VEGIIAVIVVAVAVTTVAVTIVVVSVAPWWVDGNSLLDDL